MFCIFLLYSPFFVSVEPTMCFTLTISALDFARRAWLASTSGERWRNWTVSRRRPLTSLSSPPKGLLGRNGHALLIDATQTCDIEFAKVKWTSFYVYILHEMKNGKLTLPINLTLFWFEWCTLGQSGRRPSISTTASLQQAATSDPSTSPGPSKL